MKPTAIRISVLISLAATGVSSSGCVLAALGAVGALAVAGSGPRTESIEIGHPAHVGYLERNIIRMRYEGAEQEYGLPSGSLADDASMSELSPQRACFDVLLRNRDELAARYVDLRQWQVAMTTNDDFSMPPTGYSAFGAQASSFQGQRPRQVIAGYTTECVQTDSETGACRRWEERPNYSTVYDPAVITVVAGGGQICFAHNGRITPQTEWVELSLLGPDGDQIAFEWDFRDPPEQVANR